MEEKEKTKDVGGRPRILDDEKDAQLKALCRMLPNIEDCAAYFQCSTKTIQRHIKEKYGIGFVQFREQNQVHTRLKLIRKALNKAEDGDNQMLMFALKNMCKWADRVENNTSIEIDGPIFVDEDEECDDE